MYQLPNSTDITLAKTTWRKEVKMSTFLDNGNILIQLEYRYFIYDRNGNFIDEVDFDDVTMERNRRES